MKSLKASNENDLSVEMSMKREVSRARKLMDVVVSWFDVKIMKRLAKLSELRLKLVHACFGDYLPALVPIVQTYLRETLEISEAASKEHESGDGSSSSETDHPQKEDEKEGDSGEDCFKEKEGDHRLKSDGVVAESNIEKEAALPANKDYGCRSSSDMPELQHDYEDHTEYDYRESSRGTLEEVVKDCRRPDK